MTNNILGIILCFLLIAVVIGASTILQKFKILSSEGARKFIHIGVAHDWIILMLLFDNMWLACIPPAVFVFLNYASYRLNLIKSMERTEKNSLGTVYFPISLLVLVIATFLLDMTYLGAVGMLVLGYGDGLAGWIGERYGKNKIYKNKSLQGSTAMFISAFVVSFIVMSIFTPSIAISGSIIIAILATAIELFTPLDFDNLTVPIGSAAIYYGLIVVGSAATNLILAAIVLNLLIALAAYKKHALDSGGTIAALMIGMCIFIFAGMVPWLMLMVFFASSSVISYFKKEHKIKLSSEYEKVRRNYRQVLANGSVPAIFSILYFFTQSDAVMFALIASVAVCCSDTWASELGVLNKGKTVSIASFKPVDKGSSGGVSIFGTAVAAAGAFLIAFLFSYSLLWRSDIMIIETFWVFTSLAFFGLVGSLIDSLIGATIQAKFIDAKTQKITESPGAKNNPNKKISGIRFITNGTVNFMSVAITAVIALIYFGL